MRFLTGAVVLAGLLVPGGGVEAQAPLAAATYRVFLRNGQALPSYGDAARVGDRLVFNLPIVGANEQLSLQLMSLPASLVDIDRTARYAETMRAAHYAATRGESDFAALTAAVTRNLGLISGVEDQKRQLLLAEDQRDQLQNWSREHFNYRAKDIQKLVGLISDVINELRARSSGSSLSLDLVSGPIEPVREPLLPVPGRHETVELALAAALVADIGEERIAILRTTLATLAESDRALRGQVASRLEAEIRAGRAYAALAAEFKRRADAAIKAGSVRAVEQLQSELMNRDQQLGFRRPQDVQALVETLEATLAAVRRRRLALDRYAATYRSLLAYERRVRSAFSGLDGLSPALRQIRDMKPLGVDDTITAGLRLESLRDAVARIAPPADLAAIHSTLVSALGMAREACVRRQQANVTTKSQAMLEASSAAAGALLLAERARADLVTALFPPRVQ